MSNQGHIHVYENSQHASIENTMMFEIITYENKFSHFFLKKMIYEFRKKKILEDTQNHIMFRYSLGH